MLTISDRCYICIPYLKKDEEFISDLQKIFTEVVIHQGEKRPDENQLKDIVKEYESIIIGAQEVMSREVAKSAKGLKSIGSLSTGLDHINLPAFEERGIEILSVSQANSVSVAEHAIGLILCLQKDCLNLTSLFWREKVGTV